MARTTLVLHCVGGVNIIVIYGDIDTCAENNDVIYTCICNIYRSRILNEFILRSQGFGTEEKIRYLLINEAEETRNFYLDWINYIYPLRFLMYV